MKAATARKWFIRIISIIPQIAQKDNAIEMEFIVIINPLTSD